MVVQLSPVIFHFFQLSSATEEEDPSLFHETQILWDEPHNSAKDLLIFWSKLRFLNDFLETPKVTKNTQRKNMQAVFRPFETVKTEEEETYPYDQMVTVDDSNSSDSGVNSGPGEFSRNFEKIGNKKQIKKIKNR